MRSKEGPSSSDPLTPIKEAVIAAKGNLLGAEAQLSPEDFRLAQEMAQEVQEEVPQPTFLSKK